MNQDEKNILLNQYMGEKPSRMWRIWYNKERDYGSICIPTKEGAELAGENYLRLMKSYGELPEDFLLSEPEEYDEWWRSTNYFGDMNNIKDLRDSLNEAQKLTYASYLYLGKDCSFQDDCTNRSIFNVLNKDASEHAEAIGQTLKLW